MKYVLLKKETKLESSLLVHSIGKSISLLLICLIVNRNQITDYFYP